MIITSTQCKTSSCVNGLLIGPPTSHRRQNVVFLRQSAQAEFAHVNRVSNSTAHKGRKFLINQPGRGGAKNLGFHSCFAITNG